MMNYKKIIRQKLVYVVAGPLLLLSAAAHADPIQTITFAGTFEDQHGSSQGDHGQPGSPYDGDSYSVTFSYDPATADSSDSCRTGPATSCKFTFNASSELTETITINGKSWTFADTSGYVDFSVGRHGDTISFDVSGPDGLTLTGDFTGDSTDPSFFLTPGDANDRNLVTFTGEPLTTGTWQISSDTLNLSGNADQLSADPPAPVPEPPALALLAVGLTGLAAISAVRRGAFPSGKMRRSGRRLSDRLGAGSVASPSMPRDC